MRAWPSPARPCSARAPWTTSSWSASPGRRPRQDGDPSSVGCPVRGAPAPPARIRRALTVLVATAATGLLALPAAAPAAGIVVSATDPDYHAFRPDGLNVEGP